MVEQFLHHIRRCELFRRRDKILLAVSGGMDSVAMVHLFRSAGLNAAIAHCNFQLRGDASAADATFVERLAKENGMDFHCRSFETDRVSHHRKISVQMAARELRNTWFDELLRDQGYAAVATAHHLNDTLETVLFNLAKGTGVDGIAGIPVKAGNFVRPMLFLSRSQIEGYVRKESLSWREDSSNETDDYQRNIVRHHVVPVLREINPNLEGTFSDTVVRLRAARDFVRAYLMEFNARILYYRGRQVHIRRQPLRQHPYGSVILWELLKDLGFNFDQCRDMTENDHQTGSVFGSATHRIAVARDDLVLSGLATRPAASAEIPLGATGAELEGRSLTIEVKDRGRVALTADPLVAQMDADRLTFPLLWRYWKEGDRFVPLGMTNHKKLSDFLVDEKVSLPDKDHITVVESAGEIVWVAGLRLSEKAKVTDATAHVLVMSMQG